MNSVFERIRYSSNLPARVEIKQGKIAEVYHWHKEIELIYVLDGEVTVTVNNTEQVLCADEFVLINFCCNVHKSYPVSIIIIPLN